MRRACSSDVRSVSFLGRDGPVRGPNRWGEVYRRLADDQAARYRPSRSMPRPPPAARDRRSAARRDPLADLGGRDRQRRDREQLDPVRAARAKAITASRTARSMPGRVAAPIRASSSTRSGRIQVGKAASSSAPSRNTGSRARAPRASRPCARTDRARPRRPRSTRTRAREPGGAQRAVSTSLWPGSATTRRAGARAGSARQPPAQARGARCAVDRTRRRGSRSRRSLPDHDLVADLDLGARLDSGGAERLVELLALGRQADDAKPLTRPQHLESPSLGRLGWYSRNAGSSCATGTGSCTTWGQSAKSSVFSSSMPRRSRTRRGGRRRSAHRRPRRAQAPGRDPTC